MRGAYTSSGHPHAPECSGCSSPYHVKASLGDGLGANIQSPIPIPDGRWSNPRGITRRQQPRRLPWEKPIPINTRDIAEELRRFTDPTEKEIARVLFSTWNAQADAIKFQEIENAIATGELSREWLDDWQEDYAKFINETLDPDWREGIDTGADFMAGSIAESLGIAWEFPDTTRRIERFIEERGAALAVNLSQAQMQATRNLLRRSIADQGLTNVEIGKRLRAVIGLTPGEELAVARRRAKLTALAADGKFPKNRIERSATRYSQFLKRRRATRIARTESALAFNYGALEGMREAISEGVIVGRVEKEFSTSDDERVCPFCGPLDGQIIGVEETFPGRTRLVPNVFVPPLHPNCLLGDTAIAALGISATSKRWYDGNVITIETASGNKITCTPNHPILTPRGFVPAGSLDVGGNVVSHRVSERESFGDVDSENVPPRIEDVVKAFGRSPQVTSVPVPTSPEDFHGDGVGSEVAVIGTDSLLCDSNDSALAQHFAEHVFASRDTDSLDLPSLGSLDLDIERHFAATGSGIRSGNEPLAFGGGSVRHTHEHRGASTAFSDTSLAQNAARDSTGNPVALGELFFTNAGNVFFDDIVSIEISSFSGHVYNLSTETGTIIADNIITHNCRCTVQYTVLESSVVAKPIRGGTPLPSVSSVVPTPGDGWRVATQRRTDIVLRSNLESSDLITVGTEGNADFRAAQKQLKKALASSLDDADIFIRAPGGTLETIVNEGRFKSQFETRTSGGLLDTDTRENTEKFVFGVDFDVAPDERPIYGYLAKSRNGLGHRNDTTLDRYGEARIKLKRSAKERTTFTVGDSLEETRGGQLEKVTGSPVSRPAIRSMGNIKGGVRAFRSDTLDGTIEELVDINRSGGVQYWESQTHGGVSIDDIDEVFFSDEPSESLKRALDEKSIRWSVNNELDE